MAEQKDNAARSAEALHALADGPQSPPVSGEGGRGSAAMDAGTRHDHLHNFKAVMIPLLVVVAVLLFVLGGAAARTAFDGGEREALSDGDFFAKHGRWFVLAGFPVGAILTAGAWWFHRDLGRARKG